MTACISIGYCCALIASIVIYRRYFHQLRDFPGPWQAGLTKLWHVWHIQDGKNHLFLEHMHQKYGEIVRTGPNELTICHPDIHRLVDGPGNTCTKSAFYDVVMPDISLITCRDKVVHDQRRRMWFRGLSSKSMNEYESRMLPYVRKLCEYFQTRSEAQEPVTVSDAFFWLAWDVTGDISFGKSFGMLENQEWHEAFIMLKRALSILGTAMPVPWAIHIAFKYLNGRWVVRDWRNMKQVCYDIIIERLQIEDPKEDVFQGLIAEAKAKETLEDDIPYLNGDAVVAMVAGSDPVASTLVFLFSHLARDKLMQDQLFNELRSCDVEDTSSLKSCEYLTAIVDETLRLYPPLMTGGMRDTGPEGLRVGDTFIPPGTSIVPPRWSIDRLGTCFVRPDEFLPERWTTHPELNLNKKAFIPFGIGSNSCVGKNIVWSQVRLVTAAIVEKFHIDLAPGETGLRACEDLKDYLAPCPGRLDLVFKARS